MSKHGILLSFGALEWSTLELFHSVKERIFPLTFFFGIAQEKKKKIIINK
jgi:hypothetical protein